MEGLLSITDNLVDDKVIKPQNCICYDEDDYYLVFAADKGTATFSDIANEISLKKGFWLGDAFAYGGSRGYDHKAIFQISYDISIELRPQLSILLCDRQCPVLVDVILQITKLISRCSWPLWSGPRRLTWMPGMRCCLIPNPSKWCSTDFQAPLAVIPIALWS